MAKQNAMLLLLFFSLFAATISGAHARAIPEPICAIVGMTLNITTCKPIILNKDLSAGSLPECCANLKIVKVLAAILEPQTTSQCVQAQLSTTASTSVVECPTADVDVNVSVELQTECDINLGFNIDATA